MHIIYRTCSAVSQKPRPAWFSKEACLRNLAKVFSRWGNRFHIVCDGEMWPGGDDICFSGDVEWLQINEHHNAKSFLAALDYACTLGGDLYLVEDDFLHLPGAAEVLADGLDHFDYVTGYDHPDKYLLGHVGFEAESDMYTLPVLGNYCHFKGTCSTVMTFAVKADTLREDAKIWRRWSQEKYGCTRDHLAFCELRAKGRTVGSSLPAYSTHCEPDWLAPLVDWEAVQG